MTTDDRDAALRARFRALAAEDARIGPRFTRPTVVGRRAPSVPVLAAAAAALALVAGGLAWWARDDRPVPYPIDPAAVAWTAPTDVLLDTPGASLLREIPTIETRGRPPDADRRRDDTLRRNRT